mmetsp:Transcript_19690/g.54670  ORF Transcript_19690/g.54670 Transcript_19690/m.54670 type:complete len:236 (-) Transcript_19690:1284-1991(-)
MARAMPPQSSGTLSGRDISATLSKEPFTTMEAWPAESLTTTPIACLAWSNSKRRTIRRVSAPPSGEVSSVVPSCCTCRPQPVASNIFTSTWLPTWPSPKFVTAWQQVMACRSGVGRRERLSPGSHRGRMHGCFPAASTPRAPRKSRLSVVRVPVLSKQARRILPAMAMRAGLMQKTAAFFRRSVDSTCPAISATGRRGLSTCDAENTEYAKEVAKVVLLPLCCRRSKATRNTVAA